MFSVLYVMGLVVRLVVTQAVNDRQMVAASMIFLVVSNIVRLIFFLTLCDLSFFLLVEICQGVDLSELVQEFCVFCHYGLCEAFALFGR